ncbi:MAG: pyroglutamyl-peptidase I family protein [Aureliella sp.]
MRVLLTAFEAYAEWPTNSSWLTLAELLRHRHPSPTLVTRRYPVDFTRLEQLLAKDLAQDFDAVLHLGQAPGTPMIRLEALAINAGGSTSEGGSGIARLVGGAPEAYRSRMPLEHWNQLLLERAIPTQISYHAGTYLCNALMYLSHHWMAQQQKLTPVGFVHLPLTTQQVAQSGRPLPSLPVETLAHAVSTLLDDLQQHGAEVPELARRDPERA